MEEWRGERGNSWREGGRHSMKGWQGSWTIQKGSRVSNHSSGRAHMAKSNGS